jgi:hypothetical protein
MIAESSPNLFQTVEPDTAKFDKIYNFYNFYIQSNATYTQHWDKVKWFYVHILFSLVFSISFTLFQSHLFYLLYQSDKLEWMFNERSTATLEHSPISVEIDVIRTYWFVLFRVHNINVFISLPHHINTFTHIQQETKQHIDPLTHSLPPIFAKCPHPNPSL